MDKPPANCLGPWTLKAVSRVGCHGSPRCHQGVEPGFEAPEDLPTFRGPILGRIRLLVPDF